MGRRASVRFEVSDVVTQSNLCPREPDVGALIPGCPSLLGPSAPTTAPTLILVVVFIKVDLRCALVERTAAPEDCRGQSSLLARPTFDVGPHCVSH